MFEENFRRQYYKDEEKHFEILHFPAGIDLLLDVKVINEFAAQRCHHFSCDKTRSILSSALAMK
jgi:hypothetical protein